jgi:hypothetical protein
MQRIHVPTRDTIVSSPKLDNVAGEMGALVIIGKFSRLLEVSRSFFYCRGIYERVR